jgi:hypothetical protein
MSREAHSLKFKSNMAHGITIFVQVAWNALFQSVRLITSNLNMLLVRSIHLISDGNEGCPSNQLPFSLNETALVDTWFATKLGHEAFVLNNKSAIFSIFHSRGERSVYKLSIEKCKEIGSKGGRRRGMAAVGTPSVALALLLLFF